MKTLAPILALAVAFEASLRADTYSTSPSAAWTASGDSLVFDSASNGTLGSTTTTQSTSTTAGLSGPVSLEKKGSGTLTVNGVHSFTGDLLVREGTLAVGDGTHDKDNPRNSALGDPLTARKIVVYTNATLSVTKAGLFGNAKTSTADILSDLEIRGGDARRFGRHRRGVRQRPLLRRDRKHRERNRQLAGVHGVRRLARIRFEHRHAVHACVVARRPVRQAEAGRNPGSRHHGRRLVRCRSFRLAE